MWSFFNNIFDELVASGWPLDVLIGLIILGLATYIFLYFKRADKVQLKFLSELTNISKTNTELMGKTNNIIEDLLSTKEVTNTMLGDLRSSVLSLTYNIESLINVDERVPENQAKLVYDGVIEIFFRDINEFYFATNKWLNQKQETRLGEKVQEQLTQRCDLVFDSLLSEVRSKLSNFKYKDNYLSIYLNTSFADEVTEVKSHVHATLSNDSNGMKEYLSVKRDRFNTDFQLYLKGKS